MFDTATVDEVKGRLARLRPDSPRLWGRMNPAQTMAHCAVGVEMATGHCKPPRMLVGRLIGGAIKRLALGNEAPMRKNSPTAPSLVVLDEREFEAERTRLVGLIDRFAAGGPAGCTTHPHVFFGKLTPKEWSELMYKHLDHHLRQFGG